MAIALFLVSCESEDYFYTIESSSTDYTYLSLDDKEFKESSVYTTSIFNAANKRFYSTTKIVDGFIVQALDEDDLMMSSNLIAYFQDEVRDFNEKIKKGEMAVYMYSENPYDYLYCNQSQKNLFFPAILSRAVESNKSDDDYTPLNLEKSDDDDMERTLKKIKKDKSGGGYKSLNYYFDLDSYKKWNMASPYFTKIYEISINGKTYTYEVNICNMKYANGGNDKNYMYDISYPKSEISDNYYFVGYRNPYHETALSIGTSSRDVYEALFP